MRSETHLEIWRGQGWESSLTPLQYLALLLRCTFDENTWGKEGELFTHPLISLEATINSFSHFRDLI